MGFRSGAGVVYCLVYLCVVSLGLTFVWFVSVVFFRYRTIMVRVFRSGVVWVVLDFGVSA